MRHKTGRKCDKGESPSTSRHVILSINEKVNGRMNAFVNEWMYELMIDSGWNSNDEFMNSELIYEQWTNLLKMYERISKFIY